MNSGEKIRKIREKKGMTQEGLGMEMGIAKSAAGPTIRKYETGLISPKAKLREKLIEALNVDKEAIYDFNLSSPEAVIHALFELEECWGMSFEQNGEKTVFSFDSKNDDAQALLTYINRWHRSKTLLFGLDDLTEEQSDAYLLWKTRFIEDTVTEFEKKRNEIEQYYSTEKETARRKVAPVTTTSDMTRVLCRLIDEEILRDSLSCANHGIGYVFDVQDILSRKTQDEKQQFALFLMNIDYLKNLNDKMASEIVSEFQIKRDHLEIIFFLPRIPAFLPIKALIDKVLEYKRRCVVSGDTFPEPCETIIKYDLELYYNNIKDEVNSYYSK